MVDTSLKILRTTVKNRVKGSTIILKWWVNDIKEDGMKIWWRTTVESSKEMYLRKLVQKGKYRYEGLSNTTEYVIIQKIAFFSTAMEDQH